MTTWWMLGTALLCDHLELFKILKRQLFFFCKSPRHVLKRHVQDMPSFFLLFNDCFVGQVCLAFLGSLTISNNSTSSGIQIFFQLHRRTIALLGYMRVRPILASWLLLSCDPVLTTVHLKSFHLTYTFFVFGVWGISMEIHQFPVCEVCPYQGR